MPWNKGYITAFCLVTSWPLFALSAEETRDDVNTQAKVSQQAESDDVPWWLSSHETVSKTIGNWSTNIDSFLSGEQSREPSDSYLEVRFGSVLSGSDRSGFFDFRTRLKLPNTQDRLRLVVESEPDSLAPESLRGESSQQKGVVNSALKSNVSAAVRYIKDDIGLDVDAGIRVDFPLDPFLRLRLKQGEVTDQWSWWQNQEAFAYYSKGIGARYGVGLGYAVSPTLNFGSDFGVTWLDKEGLFYVRENFSIQHRLDDKNRLGYQLSFLQSGDNSIGSDSFLYNVQYERLLYKDWLIGQIIPQFTHEADDGYDGTFSLTLSLAILLGPEYLR
ncbi:MAG: hypothetical protein KJ609_12510 [Gammaproteobacteria bacterium]|jgi:hypothetical protein|uniref:hypothetical protein n=1 Tax=Marinomonas TaxID=28253 RepID=UPI000C28EA62|nr:hypothetical protein [Marinomonas sp. ef1]MBU1295129.1 hypothetical protein [Gammaproteobacteria bacterium]MBU1465423.1 hypothetical protein [Gammaproteobacteria bacterium]MBU2021507.1 hypothetical protein [Gammaproteobacteria bacterium]MBU2319364.1 hypothetical protein [Gammaproteobacteria bacterium]MBU2415242.1 hypothetical protein [Gammaproteobacteria bacterium]|tara:strand:- start:1408 stop:2400 length:993 start_codon:yes stop_codon:yes gene_type:complete